MQQEHKLSRKEHLLRSSEVLFALHGHSCEDRQGHIRANDKQEDGRSEASQAPPQVSVLQQSVGLRAELHRYRPSETDPGATDHSSLAQPKCSRVYLSEVRVQEPRIGRILCWRNERARVEGERNQACHFGDILDGE